MNTPLLDVLIIESKDTPREFVMKCKTSVVAAVNQSPYPINVIVTPGVPGHVGQAMMDSLRTSTADYVCWVDDDDWVLPRAFAVLAPALAMKPIAVCARELQVFKHHTQPSYVRHHLTAYKSTWIKAQDLTPFKATPLVYLLKRLPENAIDVIDHVYMRRMRLSPAMQLRQVYWAAESKLWF